MIIKVQASKKYHIKIEEGLITKIGLPLGFIITDTNLSSLYTRLIENRIFLAITAGEESKSIGSYTNVIERLGREGEKVKEIVAFGGGVVGDLAGFVASTYKRGIPLVHVPTSLLAMVDSSIGGKNGINLGNKKNYLGTIYQPSAVLIDTLFLRTLPEKELRNGLAEIIRYSFVFGKPELEELKEIQLGNLNDLIAECCEIKAAVIGKDEKDSGYRRSLNFGHTIGHAIELSCGLSHGEAISIGMVKESELAKSIGLTSRDKTKSLRKVLEANSLPTELPENFSLEEVLGLMKQDKKGEFVFAFDEKNYNVPVEEKVIREIFGK